MEISNWRYFLLEIFMLFDKMSLETVFSLILGNIYLKVSSTEPFFRDPLCIEPKKGGNRGGVTGGWVEKLAQHEINFGEAERQRPGSRELQGGNISRIIYRKIADFRLSKFLVIVVNASIILCSKELKTLNQNLNAYIKKKSVFFYEA